MGNWQLDPYHTQVEFSAKHFGMMTVRGHFAEVSTTADIDPEHPETSSVEATKLTYGAVEWTYTKQKPDGSAAGNIAAGISEIAALPAGLSAALMLGRCRRRVLVCDLGQPRNRRSRALHGYLTRDGIAPAEFIDRGRRELTPYGVEWRCVGVTTVRGVSLSSAAVSSSEKNRSTKNEIVAPRIFNYQTLGSGWPNGPVTTPEKAREYVRWAAANNIDDLFSIEQHDRKNRPELNQHREDAVRILITKQSFAEPQVCRR